MKLKNLFADDNAVSPVIGVILMVAITVILAAVIGTFVLGLGDQVSQASPNAQFGFEYTEATNNWANITHDGGDGVEASQLSVQIGGTEVWTDGETTNVSDDSWSGSKITAGATVELHNSHTDVEINDGDTVKVIWTADGSDKTAVIGESEVAL